MSEPTRRKKAFYGWVPDLPDARDHLYAAPPPTLSALPPSVDLTDGCPKTVYDQGHIGSCTANAIAGAFEFDLLKQHLTDFMPSRLFIYYNERAIEGTVGFDSGAMIRDGIKSVATQGVCPEDEWPYDDTAAQQDGSWPASAKAGQKPDAQCYTEAEKHTATSYQRVVRDLDQLKGCLAAGYPFVFGFSVYEGFESSAVAHSGVANLPRGRREAARRPRGARGRLRRHRRAVPGTQLLGLGVGSGRLLHDAVRLPDRPEPVLGLLDRPRRRLRRLTPGLPGDTGGRVIADTASTRPPSWPGDPVERETWWN